jgi:hypothetical protein
MRLKVYTYMSVRGKLIGSVIPNFFFIYRPQEAGPAAALDSFNMTKTVLLLDL